MARSKDGRIAVLDDKEVVVVRVLEGPDRILELADRFFLPKGAKCLAWLNSNIIIFGRSDGYIGFYYTYSRRVSDGDRLQTTKDRLTAHIQHSMAVYHIQVIDSHRLLVSAPDLCFFQHDFRGWRSIWSFPYRLRSSKLCDVAPGLDLMAVQVSESRVALISISTGITLRDNMLDEAVALLTARGFAQGSCTPITLIRFLNTETTARRPCLMIAAGGYLQEWQWGDEDVFHASCKW